MLQAPRTEEALLHFNTLATVHLVLRPTPPVLKRTNEQDREYRNELKVRYATVVVVLGGGFFSL